MFDFRYHALSLAAVLIALAIGVLLGVAIGDSNLVSSAKRGVARNLRNDVSQARAESARLRGQLSGRSTFEDQVYPDVVGGRLAGRHIALIFLGNPSDRADALVRTALDHTGGQLSVVAVIREPLDLTGLAAQAGSSRYRALASSPALVRPLGVRLGVQLTRATHHRLLDRMRTRLLSSFTGTLAPVDGVVLMRDRPAGGRPEQARAEDDLESGLVAGMTAGTKPVVGVEMVSTNPSQVPWYAQQNLASVDDLDDIAGRTALVFALTGSHGTYGVKPTAQALLPRAASMAPAP